MQAKSLDTQDKRTSEIAAAVQAGEADILRLWAAVERFAWQQTLRWVRAMEGRAGVEESDLLQVAFISLMDTLPTWDVNKGEFLTLYGIKLKAEFTEACGQRTQRTRCDPINTVCRSMDEPIGDEDSDLTLGDTISDEAAEQAFEDVEQRDFQQAVQAALAQFHLIRFWISSTDGSCFSRSSGRLLVTLYSLTPIGLEMSLREYSATTLFLLLQRSRPMDGLSCSFFKIPSTADR